MQLTAGGGRRPDGVARVGGDARGNKHQLEHNTESSRYARAWKVTSTEVNPGIDFDRSGTYRSVRDASDTDARRELLTRSGITVAARISGVEGKRSASNPGAFQLEIRIPAAVTVKITGN